MSISLHEAKFAKLSVLKLFTPVNIFTRISPSYLWHFATLKTMQRIYFSFVEYRTHRGAVKCEIEMIYCSFSSSFSPFCSPSPTLFRRMKKSHGCHLLPPLLPPYLCFWYLYFVFVLSLYIWYLFVWRFLL